MKFPKFLAGLITGAFLGLIFWYWQKSTSSEEGALALLDRLAAAELRVRDLEARLRLAERSKADSGQPEVLVGLSDLWGLDTQEENREAVSQVNAEAEGDRGEQSDRPVRDDLKAINGIGPAYEQRLNHAGILTYADLSQCSAEQLREIVGLQTWHSADPQAWINESQSLLKE
ncbi:MAG: helix-hairpin-helix domain-containing protein [Candidatus Promineifilaceae bacterium]|nr:helix-hairpin-helix domain-containing protein [Candidatus Promineifilaceae bacterium]